MGKVILIMGLSGAGKSTFYNKIKSSLKSHIYLNGDELRKQFNDWDFSIEGRLRQAYRIKNIIDSWDSDFVVDIVCPLKEMREIIEPDIIFFIDRIKESLYADTNRMFEVPTKDEAKDCLYTIK